MRYSKVYYDDIWAVESKTSSLCCDWVKQLSSLYKDIESLSQSQAIKGAGAESIKNYLSEVHPVIVSFLNTICQTYMARVLLYYNGYTTQVDSGDRYTTIVRHEICDWGKIPDELRKLERRVTDASNNANRVARDIANLVSLPRPNQDALLDSLSSSRKKAMSLDEKVLNYEQAHANDFSEIDSIIDELNKLINSQLSNKRNPLASYKSGSIAKMCDLQKLVVNGSECSVIVTDFENSEDYEEVVANAFNRDVIIHEEEKESREWVRWVAIGVSVVASVALVVVTAGAASPLVCAGVGAAGGILSAAADNFADNYVETGSLTEDMDWADLAKDCVIGGVTGAISGYASSAKVVKSVVTPAEKLLFNTKVSAIQSGLKAGIDTVWDVGEAVFSGKTNKEILSVLGQEVFDNGEEFLKDTFAGFAKGLGEASQVGSALKQPIQKAIESTVLGVVESAGNTIIDTAFDVGEVVLKGGTLDDVTTVLDGGSSELVKNILVDGGEKFVESYINGKFDINPDDKKIAKKLLEKTTANLTGTVTAGVLETGWDLLELAECKIDGDSSKNCISILKENANEYIKDFANKESKLAIDTLSDDIIEKKLTKKISDYRTKTTGKVDNDTFWSVTETTAKTVNDTFSDVAETVVDSVINQKVDHVFAGDKDKTIDFGKIWDEDLDGGKKIAGDLEGNLNKNVKEQIESKKMRIEINGKEYKISTTRKTINDLSKKDYDHDGKVEIVTFGEGEVEGVLKEDYEAALALEGKGDYKDKTVQDILGLAHDVDVSPENVTVNSVKIEDVQKAQLKTRTKAKTYAISYEDAKNNSNK